MIISHEHPEYKKMEYQNAGAYWYSYEIVKNIIPRIKTDRNWMTINVPYHGADHSIVFIHNNIEFGQYEWLKEYKDLILVCSQPGTCKAMEKYGRSVLLPLSIDVDYVKQFYQPARDIKRAYVGRKEKLNIELPEDTVFIMDIERRKLLGEMGRCESVYAVGRCAIEAKVLGVKVLPYDPRFPKPSIWKVWDNKEAAKTLQEILNKLNN